MVGGRGGWAMGIEEGTCWDEHRVLYGNQLDNKLYKNIKQTKKTQETCKMESKNMALCASCKLKS